MVVISNITVFKTGYMGKYTNEEATPASATVQIIIDGSTVQSQLVDIPANDFVCLFSDWSGVNVSISHEICAMSKKASKNVTFSSVPIGANVEIIT